MVWGESSKTDFFLVLHPQKTRKAIGGTVPNLCSQMLNP